MHAIDKLEGAQFVLGGRLRLARAVDRDTALALQRQLAGLGASIELAPHRDASGGLLELDEVHAEDGDAAEPARAGVGGGPALMALDGVDHQAETVPIVRVEAAIAAPPPPDDDARFRPSRDEAVPMELALERPIAPPRPVASPPEPDPSPPAQTETQPVARVWEPVPGRIAAGALRQNPGARIGVGIVLALGLGWLLAQPYARRAERRVAALRAEADRDRYRPVDEARLRVAALDAEADSAASNGALGMAAIWIVVGAAAFAGWWRIT